MVRIAQRDRAARDASGGQRCTSASRSLATALLEGALARGLLHIGKDHGGQFLMSPGCALVRGFLDRKRADGGEQMRCLGAQTTSGSYATPSTSLIAL